MAYPSFLGSSGWVKGGPLTAKPANEQNVVVMELSLECQILPKRDPPFCLVGGLAQKGEVEVFEARCPCWG